MTEYKELQIIKHALSYYINREGATQKDIDVEKNLLAKIEDRVETLRIRYKIPVSDTEK